MLSVETVVRSQRSVELAARTCVLLAVALAAGLLLADVAVRRSTPGSSALLTILEPLLLAAASAITLWQANRLWHARTEPGGSQSGPATHLLDTPMLPIIGVVGATIWIVRHPPHPPTLDISETLLAAPFGLLFMTAVAPLARTGLVAELEAWLVRRRRYVRVLRAGWRGATIVGRSSAALGFVALAATTCLGPDDGSWGTLAALLLGPFLGLAWILTWTVPPTPPPLDARVARWRDYPSARRGVSPEVASATAVAALLLPIG
jgi:hypothetical protein